MNKYYKELTLCIKKMQLVSFTYKGHKRIVELYIYGLDNKLQHTLSAYQIQGGSKSAQYTGWKTFHIKYIKDLEILPQYFSQAREGYNPHSKFFSLIYCQLII